MSRLRIPLLLFVVCFTPAAFARVLSYAPYTNRTAIPAFQERTERYFALYERGALQNWWGPPVPTVESEVVIYDAYGLEEPRVVYRTNGEVWSVAMRGRALLISLTENGTNLWKLSNDHGATWKTLTELSTKYLTWGGYTVDLGGPHTHGFWSAVQIGTPETPFIVSTSDGIYAIDANRSARLLAAMQYPQLVGRNREGTQFLVLERAAGPSKLALLDITGYLNVLETIHPYSAIEGWISPDGRIYTTHVRSDGRYLFVRNGTQNVFVAGPYDTLPPNPGSIPTTYQDPLNFFAVPTHDYRGAWMIQRRNDKPTTLLRYTPSEGVKTMWSDPAGPDVEALHTGRSGEKLLIQVHRPRIQPERFFIDPAIAVWKVGDPAPAAYDELFLNEEYTKGFVHLDVDTVAEGDPFVFDSGVAPPPDVIISPAPDPVPGGTDVVQEWGVVRASLKQKLVLPGVARLAGAYGSFWLTDVVIYNPSESPQKVKVRYMPMTDASARVQTVETTLTLARKEQRVLRDALFNLFRIENGGGGLEFEPEGGGIFVNSRTYSKQGEGTFGYGMTATDANASASPRFPVSFAGAFPGANYRTNVLLTDTSGRGTEAGFHAFGYAGAIGRANITLAAPISGLQQMNSVNSALGIGTHESGALVVRPSRGTAIATVVAIDNRTNDATWFPPDLPAPVVRTIPAIGHVKGAHGADFRSDLYLVNPSQYTRTMMLEAKLWNTNDAPVRINFTMLPNEARVIPDALKTIFGMEGVARLRFASTGDGEGVRVTSRSYNLREDGGTFGCLIPPFNNFQSATTNEALEIIGVTAGPTMRANLGLVELSQAFNGTSASVRIRVINDVGNQIDSFTVDLPTAGGMQINDLFTSRRITPPPSAIIRIEPQTGLVGAYVTMTDNVTNDSTFVAAALAATQ
ncbi:MAG TPA: hypothetical protein VGF48_17520 [Thermoanaerobaculia bacterium]